MDKTDRPRAARSLTLISASSVIQEVCVYMDLDTDTDEGRPRYCKP